MKLCHVLDWTTKYRNRGKKVDRVVHKSLRDMMRGRGIGRRSIVQNLQRSLSVPLP